MSFIDSFISKNIYINDGKIIVDDDFLCFLKEIINDDKRFAHSLSVASLCYKVALSNNLKNPLKYYLAGVVHDIGKNYDKQKSADIIDTYYHSYLYFPKYSYHQFVGEYLVMNKLCIYDEEILEAVRYHCTGTKNMSPISKIIYACDKIDPLRDFDSSELIEAMIKDYRSGFITVLEANRNFLLSKASTTKELKAIQNELTTDCFEYYLK